MKKYEHGGQVWQGNPDQWIDFSANINPDGCPPQIQDALQQAIQSVVFYPDANMKAATLQLSKFNGVPATSLLPTAGGIDGLHHAIGTIRPKRLIILTPAFVEYEHIGDIYDIPIIFHSLLGQNRRLKLDLEAIKTDLQEDDMLVICNPINPIGTAFDISFVRELLAITNQANAWLLIDEAFIHYCPSCSAKDEIGSNQKLVIAGSMTKLFAIPGVRLGYLIAHPNELSLLREKQMPWRISAFANEVCSKFDGLESFVENSIRENYHNRTWMSQTLTQLGIAVFPSQANFLLLDMKPINITAQSLASQLRKKQILIRNCENYRSLDEYFVRIAIKSREENQKFVQEISSILEVIK